MIKPFFCTYDQQYPKSYFSFMSRGPVVHLDQRQARLVNAFDALDVFPRFQSWPRHWRLKFLNPHKSNPERFQFAQFLLGNGFPPDLFHDWVLANDVVRRDGELKPVSRGYDGAAWRHVAQLHRDHSPVEDGAVPKLYAPPTQLWDLSENRAFWSHTGRPV